MSFEYLPKGVIVGFSEFVVDAVRGPGVIEGRAFEEHEKERDSSSEEIH